MNLWDWIVVNGAGVSATVASISALAAIITASVAVNNLAKNRKDSAERSRPVVTAELRLLPQATSMLGFVVANRGASPAHDVRVTFDPPLDLKEAQTGERRHLIHYIARRYAKPIPTLAAGQELTNIWYAQSLGGDPSKEGVPMTFTVTVKYRGRDQRKKEWVDSYPLSVEVLTMETIAKDRSDDAGELRRLNTTMRDVNRQLGGLRTSLERIAGPQTEEERQRIQAHNERAMEVLGRVGQSDRPAEPVNEGQQPPQ